MASKPFHLVERAAERLRQEGLLDGASLGAPSLPPGAPLPEHPDLRPELRPELRPDAHPDLGPDLAGAIPTAVADAARTEPRPARPVIAAALLERAGMVPWNRARSRVSEEIRLLQSQLLRSAFAPADGRQTPLNLVMVTSARPGEGKSFAALNIAAGIARQQDREVLLVDADGKPASLGQKLGLADAPGLLDLISSPGLDLAELVVPSELPKLSVLPIGRPLEQSAELFATRQMASVIGGLGRRYADRIVILDAPPCLSSSDPSTLAPLVGQVVFVIQAEQTQREEVESALDLVQTCPTIMLLLNKVQMNTTHTFGAYASPYA
jgi:protein-tyrosine kinase